LLQFFEYDDAVVRECDQAVMRLREAMAADPAPIPVANYIKQIYKKVA
jgi:hypothetical protein